MEEVFSLLRQHPQKHREDGEPPIAKVEAKYSVIAVADGMGGRGSGKTAGGQTQAYHASRKILELIDAYDFTQYRKEELQKKIETSFKALAQASGTAAPSGTGLKGTLSSGYPTTLALAVVYHRKKKVTAIWSGDSRLYGIFERNIIPLTTDHVPAEDCLYPVVSRPLNKFISSERVNFEEKCIDLKNYSSNFGQCLGLFVCTDGLIDCFSSPMELALFVVEALSSEISEDPSLEKLEKLLGLWKIQPSDDLSISFLIFPPKISKIFPRHSIQYKYSILKESLDKQWGSLWELKTSLTELPLKIAQYKNHVQDQKNFRQEIILYEKLQKGWKDRYSSFELDKSSFYSEYGVGYQDLTLEMIKRFERLWSDYEKTKSSLRSTEDKLRKKESEVNLLSEKTPDQIYDTGTKIMKAAEIMKAADKSAKKQKELTFFIKKLSSAGQYLQESVNKIKNLSTDIETIKCFYTEIQDLQNSQRQFQTDFNKIKENLAKDRVLSALYIFYRLINRVNNHVNRSIIPIEFIESLVSCISRNRLVEQLKTRIQGLSQSKRDMEQLKNDLDSSLAKIQRRNHTSVGNISLLKLQIEKDIASKEQQITEAEGRYSSDKRRFGLEEKRLYDHYKKMIQQVQ